MRPGQFTLGTFDGIAGANATNGAAGNVGPDYTYTAGGRLKTRTWARSYSGTNRIVTTYKYGFDDALSGNHFPELTEVSYNDSVTASITNGYDRRGRHATVARNGMTTTRSLTDAGLLLSESYSGSGTTLNGLSVNATYDGYLRRQTLATKNGATTIGSSTYSYDTASRLDTVTDGTYSATYAYLPNSPLLDTATFKQSGTTRMTTQRKYDYLNRLQSIANTPSGAGQLPASYSYLYNDANQRTRMTLGDGSYWVYEYDALGQVKSGKHYWSDNSPIPGQQFEYGFDDIGNRNSTKSGGDSTGQNLRSATYTANALNQYTERTIPGGFDILGLATAANSVTVNGSLADYRRGEYFQESVTTTNTAPLWQSVTVIAGTATNTGYQYVAQTPESPTFDLDGNTTQDGRWTYTWDGENRLIALESLGSAPAGSKRRLLFEYDWMGRRIGKKVYIYSGSAYPGSPNTTLKFLYDGWNLMAELDGTNGTVRTYQWGLDLSGSLQGAGGVGGLLTVKPTSGIAQFQGCDGNGNIMLSVDGSNGTRSAEFEYGPFGETLRASGTSSAACLNRFSTKYQDGDSSFYYYGYRYYDPSTGRWPNRDPAAERHGKHIYQTVKNSLVNRTDFLGLFCNDQCTRTRINEQSVIYLPPGVSPDEVDDIKDRANRLDKVGDQLDISSGLLTGGNVLLTRAEQEWADPKADAIEHSVNGMLSGLSIHSGVVLWTKLKYQNCQTTRCCIFGPKRKTYTREYESSWRPCNIDILPGIDAHGSIEDAAQTRGRCLVEHLNELL